MREMCKYGIARTHGGKNESEFASSYGLAYLLLRGEGGGGANGLRRFSTPTKVIHLSEIRDGDIEVSTKRGEG